MTEPAPVSDRHTLAARQAHLVAALIGRAEPPPGFDLHRLELTARTLIRKRWTAVRRHFPVLTAALRGSHRTAGDLFEAWARSHRAAGGLPGGGHGDGVLFARHLMDCGQLPAVAVAEVGVALVGGTVRGGPVGGQVVPRRWVGVTAVRVGGRVGLAVGSAARFRLYWVPLRFTAAR